MNGPNGSTGELKDSLEAVGSSQEPDSHVAATSAPDRSVQSPAGTDYTIDSVVASLRVVLMLEDPPHRLRVSDVARNLGTTRNRAFRLVKTLESEGFLFHHEDGAYGMGIRLSQFTRNVDRAHDIIVATAQPLLDELAASSGESTLLCVLTADSQCLCVAVAESSAHVRSVPECGLLAPLNAGGAAKVLFTFQPKQRREELAAGSYPRHTAYSKDGAEMLAEAPEIARDGYAVALEEFHTTADSVGAPIWTEDGVVIAALGLVGPSARIREQLPMPIAGRVLDVAREISRLLGGNPDELPKLPQ